MYAYNDQAQSVGGMIVLPLDALGSRYIAVTNFERRVADSESQLLIVAAHDNTQVTVTFPPHGLFTSISVPGQSAIYSKNSVYTVSLLEPCVLQKS